MSVISFLNVNFIYKWKNVKNFWNTARTSIPVSNRGVAMAAMLEDKCHASTCTLCV